MNNSMFNELTTDELYDTNGGFVKVFTVILLVTFVAGAVDGCAGP